MVSERKKKPRKNKEIQKHVKLQNQRIEIRIQQLKGDMHMTQKLFCICLLSS